MVHFWGQGTQKHKIKKAHWPEFCQLLMWLVDCVYVYYVCIIHVTAYMCVGVCTVCLCMYMCFCLQGLHDTHIEAYCTLLYSKNTSMQ